MTDVVERLRDWPRMTPVACAQAADELERLQAVVVSGDREIKASHADADRLRAEITRLRAALKEIADDPGGFPAEAVVDEMREAARRALEERK